MTALADSSRGYFPYSFTFTADNPGRFDSDGRRWEWLCHHLGTLGQDWDWLVPWEPDMPLVYYFKTENDLALFVLVWG